MAKIGKAAMDEPQAQDPTAAAARRREDLKRAIEAGVLGPLRSTQEGVDPSLDKPEKKDEPDLDIEQPVDVPAQEDARSWEEAVVKMKKQKAERAAKPPKPKAPPNMERFIQSLLSEERVEQSRAEERMEKGIEQRRDALAEAMDLSEAEEIASAATIAASGGDADRTNTDIYAQHLPKHLRDDPEALKAAARDAAQKQYAEEHAADHEPDQTWDVEVDMDPWVMERYGDRVWLVNPETGEVLRQPDVSDPNSPLYSDEEQGALERHEALGGDGPMGLSDVMKEIELLERN